MVEPRALLALLICGIAWLGTSDDTPPAFELLGEHFPSFDWLAMPEEGDFDCDGSLDLALFDWDGDDLILVMILDAEAAPRLESLRLTSLASELCLVGDRRQPLLERVDQNLPEHLPGKPAGMQVCKSGSDLLLDVGECDGFQVYWNHELERIDWWRN